MPSDLDIVSHLRAFAQGEARSGIGRQRWKLFRDAADEIERLKTQLYHATVAVDGIREHALEEAAQAAEINNQHWITGIDRAIRSLKEQK